MGGIRDEGQLTDKRFRINSPAGVERGGEPPRPEVIADIDLVRLVARDGGPRCELPDGFASVQVRAGRVEDHFVARLWSAETPAGSVVGLREAPFDGRFDMIQTDGVDPELSSLR
jgi:hypothetical protein